MTDRIYYRDAYATQFQARVVGRSDDGTQVALSRTAFYPTSGGQPHDIGMLNDTPVLDVFDQDDKIIHVLSASLTADEVTGHIDWTRRFDHMQQHTGQHILSAVFEDLFGHRTASVHFGVESSSVDLETGELPREQLLAAEARANAVVFDNVPVTISFEDAASAQGLRKPPPREGELRVITVDGVDRSACGGTHVRATGEIGPILLRKQDRMHGNARIEFLCGGRAVRRSRADYDAVARVSVALGTAADGAADRAAALVADLREGQRVGKRLVEQLAVYRAREAYARSEPDAEGVRWMVERLASGSLDDVRALAHTAAALEHVAFIGAVENPPQILFATSEDTGIDAGKVLRTVLTAMGGRGGGSARVAQGTLPSDAIEGAIGRLIGKA